MEPSDAELPVVTSEEQQPKEECAADTHGYLTALRSSNLAGVPDIMMCDRESPLRTGQQLRGLEFSPTSPVDSEHFDSIQVKASPHMKQIIDKLFPDEESDESSECSLGNRWSPAPDDAQSSVDDMRLRDDDEDDLVGIDGEELRGDEISRALAWIELPDKLRRLRQTTGLEHGSGRHQVALIPDSFEIADRKVTKGFKWGTPKRLADEIAFEPPRKVSRHTLRGVDRESRRQAKDIEDAACNAGMRNPATVCGRWPSLVSTMIPIRRALQQAVETIPELQNLPDAIGEHAIRQPPSAEAVLKARALVAKALGLSPAEADQHHPAGKWRHRLVEWVQANCHDLDVQLAKWLRDGFPIGIDVPITPGGLLPLSRSHAEAETLDGLLWNKGNHPSFSVVNDGDDLPPGPRILREYHSKGFVSRYASRKEAEAVHGQVVVSPLGNIAKLKPDGSIKN